MADNRIGLEVDIPVAEAEKGIKSLKLQLRELKQTLQTMDEADPQFLRIAEQAGELEDRISAVNEQVRAFAGPANERALAGIVDITAGIAGGFAAAQGAVALFAGENEDLQKAMLKVQAALALVNGLQAVQNTLKKESAAMTYLTITAEKLYAAAVGKSTGAMKGFRLALISTGIGAIVVAVGLLVANWDKLTASVKKAGGPVKEFGEIFNKVKQIASGVFDAIIGYYSTIFNIIKKALKGDFSGAIDEAKNIGKNVAKAYSEGVESEMKIQEKARQDAITKSTLSVQKRELQLIEAGGKDSYAAKKAILENELKLLEEGSEEFLDKQTEIAALQISNEKKLSDERAKIQEDARKKREDEQKRQDEKRKQEEEKRIEEEKRKQEQIQGIIEQSRRDIELGELEGQDRAIRALEMAYQDQVALVEGNEEALKLLNAKFQQEREAIRDDFAAKEREKRDTEFAANLAKKKEEDDKMLAQEKAYRDNLRELAINSTMGLVGAISDINNAFAGKSEQAARRQFNIQKALSLAETIVSTYSAAQKAFASQMSIPSPDAPIRAAIAAGAAIAGGLARIAAISKTKFESKTAETPTVSTGQAAPTQTPQLNADVSRQRLSQGDSGQTDTKVFVVESDITNTQSRVATIDRRATVR